MSVWFDCRLFDAVRFNALRADLDEYIQGHVTHRIRALAREGYAALTARAKEPYQGELFRSLAVQLDRIATGPDRYADTFAMPEVNALLVASCFIDYVPSQNALTLDSPFTLVQLGGPDGNLYAEITARLPWVADLFIDGVSWPPPSASPDPWSTGGYRSWPHRTLTMFERADLDRLHEDMERLAASPSWLRELSWDGVRPESASIAFERLRRLIALARSETNHTVVAESNG